MATSPLLFPHSSDEEIEQLSDREDQSNGHELQPFQPHLQQDASRDLPSTSTDPTDDYAQQAAPPGNHSTATVVIKMATKRENPYALGLHQLAFAFQRFLAEVKSFFTQKVNLQR